RGDARGRTRRRRGGRRARQGPRARVARAERERGASPHQGRRRGDRRIEGDRREGAPPGGRAVRRQGRQEGLGPHPRAMSRGGPGATRANTGGPMTATSPVLDIDSLLAPFHEAEKPRDRYRVGTESEKFGLRADGTPIAYEGDDGVRRVLELLAERFGWVKGAEFEGGPLLSLK